MWDYDSTTHAQVKKKKKRCYPQRWGVCIISLRLVLRYPIGKNSQKNMQLSSVIQSLSVTKNIITGTSNKCYCDSWMHNKLTWLSFSHMNRAYEWGTKSHTHKQPKLEFVTVIHGSDPQVVWWHLNYDSADPWCFGSFTGTQFSSGIGTFIRGSCPLLRMWRAFWHEMLTLSYLKPGLVWNFETYFWIF